MALSQVTSWDDKEGALWNVPQDYYQPIDQQAILLNRGTSNEAALAWMDFLKSNAAIATIRGYGYDPAYDTAD